MERMAYQVSKGTCEKYDFRFNNGDWAYVLMDEAKGLFTIYSAYGTYAYSWPNRGSQSFKSFMLEILKDPDYLLSKIQPKGYFYEDKTKEAWLNQVCHDRYQNGYGRMRDIELSKEDARELYDAIKDEDFYSAERASEFLFSNKTLNRCYEHEPWFTFEPVVDYSPDVLGVMNHVLPALSEVLRQELGLTD